MLTSTANWAGADGYRHPLLAGPSDLASPGPCFFVRSLTRPTDYPNRGAQYRVTEGWCPHQGSSCSLTPPCFYSSSVFSACSSKSNDPLTTRTSSPSLPQLVIVYNRQWNQIVESEISQCQYQAQSYVGSSIYHTHIILHLFLDRSHISFWGKFQNIRCIVSYHLYGHFLRDLITFSCLMDFFNYLTSLIQW